LVYRTEAPPDDEWGEAANSLIRLIRGRLRNFGGLHKTGSLDKDVEEFVGTTKLPFLALALAWSTTVGCASLNPSKSSQNLGALGGPAAAAPSFTDKLTAWFKGDKPKSSAMPTVDTSDSALSLNNKTKPGPEVNVAMAQMAESSGKVAEAEKHYRKALAIKPLYVPALLGLAHLKDRSGELEAATKFYQKATAANPQDARPFNDLALCYHRRGMLNESVEALQKAIALQPERKLYRNNLAAVLVDMNRPEAALEQLVAADGKAVGHYNLGYLLMKKGNQSAALAEFRAAAAVDPGLDAAQQWIARLSAPPARSDIQVARQVPSVQKRRTAPGAASTKGSAAGSTEAQTPQQQSQLLQLRRAPQPAADSPLAVMEAPEPLVSPLAQNSEDAARVVQVQPAAPQAATPRSLQYPNRGMDSENPANAAVAPAPPQSYPVANADETDSDLPPATESAPSGTLSPEISGPQLGPSARRTATAQSR
jgi:tetratricopeptide (TPR) repeat protein